MASCALETRRPEWNLLSRAISPQMANLVCGQEGSWQLAYVNIGGYATQGIALPKTLTLQHVLSPDGCKFDHAENLPGLEVQPVKGLRAIKKLNPGSHRGFRIKLWSKLINEFKSDFNLMAFVYDWRLWGDPLYVLEVVDRFQLEVADAVHKSCGPVALIMHSLGANVVLYCLGCLGQHWTRHHVDRLVMIGPAMMGSPQIFSTFTCGPLGAVVDAVKAGAGIFMFDFVNPTLATTVCSWPCIYQTFPTAVAGVPAYPPDHVCALTPSRSYTVSDTRQFISDVSTCSGGRAPWVTGPLVWDAVSKVADRMLPPPRGIPTHIVYGNGFPTVNQATYGTENLLSMPKFSAMAKGDKTVTAGSIEMLARSWQASGVDIQLHLAPPDVIHKNLILCPFTLSLLSEIFRGRPLFFEKSVADSETSSDGFDSEGFEAD